jgi:enhancing lycopene biosynthesis protein 2
MDDTAGEMEKTGAIHQDCLVNDIVVDRKNKIVSTPAFGPTMFQKSMGIGKMSERLLR